MRQLIASMIAGLGCLLVAANSGRLPPIGQRTYVIDQSDPSAPVTIKNDGHQGKVFLKDPVHPSGPIKLAPIKQVKKPVAKAPPPVRSERPGRMRFGKVSVAGHIKQPRVEFSRDVLPVERADELTSPDFFQKVYEPAQRDDF